jgi:hypothetical protein
VSAGKLLTSAQAIDVRSRTKPRLFAIPARLPSTWKASRSQIAAARGLPFVAVRVIVDTAADALPRAVIARVLGRRGCGMALFGGLRFWPRANCSADASRAGAIERRPGAGERCSAWRGAHAHARMKALVTARPDSSAPPSPGRSAPPAGRFESWRARLGPRQFAQLSRWKSSKAIWATKVRSSARSRAATALFHVAADYRWARAIRGAVSHQCRRHAQYLECAARSVGVQRIVYTSSVATIGIPADGTPGDERTPVASRT